MENIEDKGGEVVQANADGAYDANDNFEFLEAHNIITAIKIRKHVESGRLRSPQRTQRAEKIIYLISALWRYNDRGVTERAWSGIRSGFG